MLRYINMPLLGLNLILFFTLAGCVSPPTSGPSGSGVSVSLPLPMPPPITKAPSGSGKTSPSSSKIGTKAPQNQKPSSGDGASNEPRSADASNKDSGMGESSKQTNAGRETKKSDPASGENVGDSEGLDDEQGSQNLESASTNGGNPGFGGKSISEDLPDMLDTPEPASSSIGKITDVSEGTGSSRHDSEVARTKSPGSGQLEDQNEISSKNGNSGLSTAERVAILDAELDQGEGRFDQAISEARAEQRKLSRTARSSENSRESAKDTRNPAFDQGLDTLDPSTNKPREIVKISRAKDDSIEKFPPPDDLPDAKNDDVTARQLRERAEREPDPEKRKVLWDRYRKYMGLK